MRPPADPDADPGAHHRTELTVRGLVIGGAITIVFMAANVYLGLKTGMTFSSSIPAAIISMAVLRLLGGGNILENNMVQTQASAAGTLCNIILVLPGLAMIGHWHGFPFWQTMSIAALGGFLGVLFSIPLRRALVVDSKLPFPEGIAAAEVLRAGNGDLPGEHGLRTLAIGSAAAAGFSFCGATGLRLLGDGLSWFFTAGHAVFRVSIGFSLALVGVGYLVGIGACAALLVGVVLAWGIAVPLLTSLAPAAHGPVAAATAVWQDQVRLIGAGIIAVGAIWTVVTLTGPMLATLKAALSAARKRSAGASLPRQERDIPITLVACGVAVLAVPLALLFVGFAAPAIHGQGFGLSLTFVVAATLFMILFGFLMATACGYLAGLLGSSSSPISGIGILSTMVVALLLAALPRLGGTNGGMLVAITVFITSVLVTTSSIANDNLQDLKTGQVVDATPWRQQVALLVGVAVGAAVIAPLLDMLYEAYGFAGNLPRPGMDPGAAMAAPQASLMTAIAKGIFSHQLPWSMVVIGGVIAVPLIAFETWLRRRDLQFPVLTVGIGMYLPPTVVVTIAVGGVVGWLAERAIRRHGAPSGQGEMREQLRRRGVLLSSGFLVGESLAGMLLAAIEAAGGQHLSLSPVGPGFADVARWLGLAGFLLALTLFYRAVSSQPAPVRLTRAADAD